MVPLIQKQCENGVWKFIQKISKLGPALVSVVATTYDIVVFALSFVFSLFYHHIAHEIDFESRKNSGSWNDCLMSIDGSDFRIPQKGAAVKGNDFASFKYKGKSALQYEIGLDILEGNLIWIQGPYPAGSWTDISIFWHCLMKNLGPYERVVADKGYVGEAPRFVKCPNSKTLQKEHQIIRHF